MAPVRWIPANDALPDTLSTYPSVRGFFKERLQYWQVKNFYYQKFHSDDKIVLYFDSSAGSAELYCVDTEGREVDILGGRIPLSPAVTETANTFNEGGTDYQYYTYCQIIKPSDYAVPDGVYFFVVEHNVSGAIYTEISEPVHIRSQKWNDTRLIEYTHSRNELVMDYILWQQMAAVLGDPMVFQLRVESHVDDGEPASADTQFVDMGERVISLQSHPYQVYNFNIGTRGVPAWMLNKVAAALSCDTFSIDAQSFVKDQGAQFSVKKFDTSGFRGATIKLRDADPQEAGVVLHGAVVELMEMITDGGDPPAIVYPFAWSCLSVYDSTLSVSGTTAAKVFEDEGELDAYIALINTDLTTYFGAGRPMLGRIIRIDNKIYYANSFGEHWIKWTAAHSVSYSSFEGMMDMTVRATSTNEFISKIWPTTGAGTRTAQVIVDFGDGTVEAHIISSSGATVNHTYASSADYNVRMFHSASDTDPLQAIGRMDLGQFFPPSDTNVIDVNPGSHTPIALEDFRMYNAMNGLGDGVHGAGFTFLTDCVLTLTSLNVFDASITASGNDVFDSLVFSVLHDVVLVLATPTAEVNDIVNAFAAMGTYSSMTGGNFHISGGGTAPPTGAALTFLDVTLAGLPCTVTHD